MIYAEIRECLLEIAIDPRRREVSDLRLASRLVDRLLALGLSPRAMGLSLRQLGLNPRGVTRGRLRA